MALIIVIRRIVIAAMLAAFIAASVVTVSASSGTAAAKATGAAVPHYWDGYWPGNPTLCVLDQTGGMPVAEAVAAFDHTVADLEIRNACGDTETIIIFIDPEPSIYAGFTNRADNGHYDADGIWVMAGVTWIGLHADHYEMPRGNWEKLLIHELGHAVGLSHTPRHDSIMNVDRIYELDGLTETDLATLERLYR